MTSRLRSTPARRLRVLLGAALGTTTLLLAGPAAAGCSPLDELPSTGAPHVEVPEPSAPPVEPRPR